MLNKQENPEDFTKLVSSMYDYAEWLISKKQELNKKIESRILACLAFSGIEIKLVSDLFNDSYLTSDSQKLFFVAWKFLAISSVIFAAWTFMQSLSVKTDEMAKFVGISEMCEKRKSYKTERIFKASITKEWRKAGLETEKLIEKKIEILNKGIWFLFYGASLYGIGIMIQDLLML